MKRIRGLWLLAGLAALPAPAQIGGWGYSGGPVGSGGFGGPAILSRGTGAIGRSNGKNNGVRFFAGVGAQYSTGITTLLGRSDDVYGVYVSGSVSAGFTTNRSWGSTSWSGGSNFDRFNGGAFRGNHGLGLTYGRILSRRWTVHTSVVGRLNSRLMNNMGTNYSEDPMAEIASPLGELFDTGSYSGGGAIGTTAQISRRVAVSLSAGSTLQRFKSSPFIGSNSFTGGAGTFYTFTRRQGVGISYRASKFYFLGQYGESFVMSVSGHYSRQLSERWRVNISGGRYQVNSTRLVSTPVDPFIAAIIGQSTFQSIVDRIAGGFSGGVQFNGRFKRSGLSLGYGSSVTPGNGILLTSSTGQSSASYSFTGTKRWNYGLNGSYVKYHSLVVEARNYQAVYGGLGATYKFTEKLAIFMSAGYSHSTSLGSSFKSDRMYFTVGTGFSPGNLALPMF